MQQEQCTPEVRKENRVVYIDVLRGIGILLMIMGHVSFGNFFSKWIHIFHMPMFFIISGFFYKKQHFGEMLKRKSKTLLVPYLIIGIFSICIHFAMAGEISPHPFRLFLFQNTIEDGIPIAGALWFLTALFFTELIYLTIDTRVGSEPWKTVIVFIMAFAGMWCATDLPFRLPLGLDAGMVGTGLYHIGKKIKTDWNQLIKIKFSVSLMGLVLFSVIGMLNGYVNLRQGKYGYWLLFWISSVGISVSLWNCVRHMTNCANQGFWKKAADVLATVGKNSMVYLCLNQLMILLAEYLTGFIINEAGAVSMIIKKILVLFISLAALYLLQKLIMNTKLKAAFGR